LKFSIAFGNFRKNTSFKLYENYDQGSPPMAVAARPRRSVLYMPGSNARALEKGRSLPADGLILDIEDAVAPDAKEAARDQIVAALAEGGYGGREIQIRVNGLNTPWGFDDIVGAG
jgi:citrate lyase subunit beta/citryl-CoA lyase